MALLVHRFIQLEFQVCPNLQQTKITLVPFDTDTGETLTDTISYQSSQPRPTPEGLEVFYPSDDDSN